MYLHFEMQVGVKKHDYDLWCIKHFEMQVGVKNLKVVGIEGKTMVREEEAKKQVYVYLIISLFI